MAASNGSGKRRRRLTVPEKYQVFLDVVSGQGSQRDIADKWRVDRSTVVHVCKTAKQGALDALALSRPGRPSSRPQRSWRWRTRWPPTAGCVMRWPSKRSNCIWCEEKSVGADRSGPHARGRWRQGRAARPRCPNAAPKAGRPRRNATAEAMRRTTSPTSILSDNRFM